MEGTVCVVEWQFGATRPFCPRTLFLLGVVFNFAWPTLTKRTKRSGPRAFRSPPQITQTITNQTLRRTASAQCSMMCVRACVCTRAETVKRLSFKVFFEICPRRSGTTHHTAMLFRVLVEVRPDTHPARVRLRTLCRGLPRASALGWGLAPPSLGAPKPLALTARTGAYY